MKKIERQIESRLVRLFELFYDREFNQYPEHLRRRISDDIIELEGHYYTLTRQYFYYSPCVDKPKDI